MKLCIRNLVFLALPAFVLSLAFSSPAHADLLEENAAVVSDTKPQSGFSIIKKVTGATPQTDRRGQEYVSAKADVTCYVAKDAKDNYCILLINK